jgi:putative exosortase-associated protein (TIGR04073 family)
MKPSTVAGAALVLLLAAGCAGPEKKLGRGMRNATEFARLGEIQRSIEQTTLWDGPNVAYTTGLVKGVGRSLLRTAVGAYEIVTFPFPTYDPVLKPGNRLIPDITVEPVYPDSYKPHAIADSPLSPDAALGFAGGDILPFSPGSRFRIFDY